MSSLEYDLASDIDEADIEKINSYRENASPDSSTSKGFATNMESGGHYICVLSLSNDFKLRLVSKGCTEAPSLTVRRSQRLKALMKIPGMPKQPSTPVAAHETNGKLQLLSRTRILVESVPERLLIRLLQRKIEKI